MIKEKKLLVSKNDKKNTSKTSEKKMCQKTAEFYSSQSFRLGSKEKFGQHLKFCDVNFFFCFTVFYSVQGQRATQSSSLLNEVLPWNESNRSSLEISCLIRARPFEVTKRPICKKRVTKATQGCAEISYPPFLWGYCSTIELS